MNLKTRITLLKICGIMMILSGLVGIYVLYEGSSILQPKDILTIVISIGAGMFFTWLGFHPERLVSKK